MIMTVTRYTLQQLKRQKKGTLSYLDASKTLSTLIASDTFEDLICLILDYEIEFSKLICIMFNLSFFTSKFLSGW